VGEGVWAALIEQTRTIVNLHGALGLLKYTLPAGSVATAPGEPIAASIARISQGRSRM
jgi:hypothetical protein